LQGSRPLLTEVQALVAPAAGTARRTAIGLDRNRLNLLSAVLERRGGLPLADQDIYVSVVGGARVKGTGSDLALCAAIVSSLRDTPVPNDLVIFGEVGLGGELRPVQATEQRLAEAKRLGFKRALLPAGGDSRAPKGMSLLEAKNLAEAVAELVAQG
jgi:DNA repair protein RadA/Sms